MEKIVLLLENKPHREQLQKLLGAEYHVRTGAPTELLAQSFDLCITDIFNFDKYRDDIRARKERERPGDVPILCLLSRQELQQRGIEPDSILNEVITTPILPAEISIRVRNLTRARILSRQFNSQLSCGRDKTPRYFLLAKDAHDMIYRISLPEGRYEFVSPSVENVFGYTPEEFYASPLLIHKIVDPEWVEYMKGQWDNLLKGDVPKTYEYAIRDKSGNRRWIYQRNVLVRDQQGHPVALEGICTDITELKKTEYALRESVDLNDRISKLVPVVLYIWDIVSARTAYINCEVNQVLGYSSEQIRQMNGELLPNIMHPEDNARFEDHLHKICSLPDGVFEELEYRMRSAGGEWRWFMSRDTVFERDEKQFPIKILGAATDITSLKKTQEELRRSEERFRLAQRLSGIGTWEWRKEEGEKVFWSEEAIRLWGYSPEEFGGTFNDVTRRIHPDDLEVWQQEVRACIEEGKEHRLDYRVLLPDGSIRWVAVYGDAERDTFGAAYRMAGVVMDITQKKEAEERQKISQERFQSLMSHTSEGFYLFELPEPISIDLPIDEQIRILYRATMVECNKAQAHMYGYDSPDDVLGKLLSDFHGVTDIPENINFLTEWIAAGYKISGMVSRERTRQGSTVWFSNNVVGIVENGTLLRIWGSQTDITQMKRVEEEIKKERNLSNMIVDSLPGMFYMFDMQGRFLRWNKMFEDVGGYSPEEISSLHPLDLFRGTEKELVARRIEQVFETGMGDVEAAFYSKDGRAIPCFFNGRLIVLDDRPILIGMGLDISERKRAEDQLHKTKEKLRLFIKHAPAALAMFDREMKYLVVSHRWKTDYKLGERQIIGKSHYEIFPEIPEHWKEAHARAMRGEVVRSDNEPIVRISGEVQWLRWEVRPWYTAAGDIGGVLIFTEDITQQKQAQEALRTSEENLRTTLNSIGDAVIATDTQGLITTMNPVAEQLTGWDAALAMGKPLTEVFRIINARTRKLLMNPVSKVLSHGKIVGLANHTLLISRKGKEYHIADSGAPIRDDSRDIRGVVLVFRDVTQEYEMREEIAGNEERFRIISELTSDFSSSFKLMPDGSMELEWSLGPIDRISGYTYQELASMGGLFSIIHQDDVEESRENFRNVKKEGTSYIQDFRITTKSGETRWLRNFGTSRRNRKGELRFYLATQDITTRKQAGERLRQKEEQLRLAMEIARLAYFEYDPFRDYTHRYGYYRLLGESDDIDNLHTDDFLRQYVHTEDLPRVLEAHDEVLHAYREIDLEFRMKRTDGRLIWVASRVKANFGPDGQVKNIIGVALDITARKQSEEALAAEKERLAVTLRSIGDGVITTDIAGKVLLINRAGEQLTGWSQEEASGKPLEEVFDIMQEKHRREKVNPVEMVLEQGTVVFLPDNTFLKKRNGSEISVADSSAPILDRGGRILGVVLVFRDITERKTYESNLHISLHQKEVLLQELYHRTKNNMQVISSLLELQAASSDSEEVDRIVRESRTRIRTMSLAHEKLYKSKSLSLINMKEYIVDLAQLLKNVYGVSEERVRFVFDIESINLLIDLAIPGGLILSELLSNSFKYAFPDKREGCIHIGLHKRKPHEIELTFRDNGVGVPQGFCIMKSRTLGLQLIRQIVKHQLHGSIRTETEGEGFGWFIRFREDLYSERV